MKILNRTLIFFGLSIFIPTAMADYRLASEALKSLFLQAEKTRCELLHSAKPGIHPTIENLFKNLYEVNKQISEKAGPQVTPPECPQSNTGSNQIWETGYPSLAFACTLKGTTRQRIANSFELFIDQYPQYEITYSKNIPALSELRRIMGDMAYYFAYALQYTQNVEEEKFKDCDTHKWYESVDDYQLSETRRWHTIGANLGNTQASFSLANYLRFGREGFKSEKSAKILYKKTAKDFNNRNNIASALRSVEALSRMTLSDTDKNDITNIISSTLSQNQQTTIIGPRGKPDFFETTENESILITMQPNFKKKVGATYTYNIISSGKGSTETPDANKPEIVKFQPNAGFYGLTAVEYTITEKIGDQQPVTGPKTPLIITVERGPITPALSFSSTSVDVTQGNSVIIPLNAVKLGTDKSLRPDFKVDIKPDSKSPDAITVKVVEESGHQYALITASNTAPPGTHTILFTTILKRSQDQIPVPKDGKDSSISTFNVIVTELNDKLQAKYLDKRDDPVNSQSKDIMLNIAKGNPTQKEFLITKQPSLGTLSAPSPSGGITYIAGDKSGLDYFSYKVKGEGLDPNDSSKKIPLESKSATVLVKVELGNGATPKPKVEDKDINTIAGNPVIHEFTSTPQEGTHFELIDPNTEIGTASLKFGKRYVLFQPDGSKTGKASIKYYAVNKNEDRSDIATLTFQVDEPEKQTISVADQSTSEFNLLTDAKISEGENQTAKNLEVTVKPDKPNDSLFTIFSARKSADSVYIFVNPANTLRFGNPGNTSLNLASATLSKVKEKQNINQSVTIAYDFTDYFSVALTRFSRDKLTLNEDIGEISGTFPQDLNVPTKSKITSVNYDQRMMSFYYYPYRYFYLGYDYIDGRFSTKRAISEKNGIAVAESQTDDLAISENLLTLGFNYDISNKWLSHHDDSLDYGRNGYGLVFNAKFSIPIFGSRNGEVEEMLMLGVGVRFY